MSEVVGERCDEVVADSAKAETEPMNINEKAQTRVEVEKYLKAPDNAETKGTVRRVAADGRRGSRTTIKVTYNE